MSKARVFTAKLAEWQQQVNDRSDELVRGVADVMFDNVHDGGKYSPGTPIEDGDARAGWSVKVGRLAIVPPHDTPEAARTQAFEEISRAKAGDSVFIANTAPHIRRLEFGWSEQAPQGFVRHAVNSAPQMIEEIVVTVATRRGRGNP